MSVCALPPALGMLLIIVAVAQKMPPVLAAPACPCKDETLCDPIRGPPVKEKEVFGFVSDASSLEEMNWTSATTIAWGSIDSVCQAHRHGARVVLASPQVVLTNNVTSRKSWISEALISVRNSFADGIVFDFESPLQVGSAQVEMYTALVRETTAI